MKWLSRLSHYLHSFVLFQSVEEREENNVASTQNHVASAADVKEEEIRCKLARTLSIGENSIHSKWESYDQL